MVASPELTTDHLCVSVKVRPSSIGQTFPFAHICEAAGNPSFLLRSALGRRSLRRCTLVASVQPLATMYPGGWDRTRTLMPANQRLADSDGERFNA